MKEIREIRETWRVCEIGEDFSEGGKDGEWGERGEERGEEREKEKGKEREIDM